MFSPWQILSLKNRHSIMIGTVLLAILFFFVLLIVCLLWYQNYSQFFKLIHKIPGPPGDPIFGNFFNNYTVPVEKIFADDRQRSLKYFPIYKQWILHVAAVSLLQPEDIEMVLANSTYNKKSKIYDNLHMWLGTGLLTSDGEKWKMRRKMLTPAFHFTILQNFIEIFNEETENLVKNLQQNVNEPFVNIVPYITEFTLKSMAETSMGTSLDLESDLNWNYKKAIYDIAEILLYRTVRPWLYNYNVFRLFPKSFSASKIVKILHSFTTHVIQERKKIVSSGSPDSYSTGKRLAMLDLMLKYKQEGANIDDEGIREEVDTFMFEGHDTTSVAICFILLLLAQHKEVQEEVRQEIIEVLGDSGQLPTYTDLQQLSYTERCIKECLRLYPSVPFIARDATEELHTTTGYTIPKGSMIHIHIFDLHRNPNIFPNPLKFDPDRFLPENIQKRHPFAYIPFSAGPRNCIGQKFAMLELKAVLCGILRKFVLEPIDNLEEYVFVTDLVIRTKDRTMRVKFLPR